MKINAVLEGFIFKGFFLFSKCIWICIVGGGGGGGGGNGG